MKIYLSPSNQENNIGAGSFGTEEQYCNIVADKIMSNLFEYNVNLYRNKPTMTVEEIINDSNNKGVDLHVAVHTNSNREQTRGCEVFCYSFGSEGHRLALRVYERLSDLTPSEDRGVKEGRNFYGPGKHMIELARTNAPAILVEIDFHDNPTSALWLLKNTDSIAQEISAGILEHLGIKDEYIKRIEVITVLKQLISSLKG